MMTIGFILLIAQAKSARYTKENIIMDAQITAYPAFIFVEQYQLSTICQDSVVHKLDIFFDGWVIKSLLTKQFKSPTTIGTELDGMIKDHVKDIENYLRDFSAKTEILKKYGQTYLDVELKDLLSRINQIIGVNFNNKYDQADSRIELVNNLGHYAGHIVNEVALRDLDLPTIQKIGKIFFEEYDKKSNDPDLTVILEDNTKAIITTLETILNIYGNNPSSEKYTKLTDAEKDTLQKFYDVFKPLLDKVAVKIQVFNLLTGNSQFREQPSDFFTPEMFQGINPDNKPLKSIITRDRFLTLYKDDFLLENLHDATADEMYSLPMVDVFDVAKFDLIKDEVDKKEEDKADRHKVRVFLVLYKVYTIARHDGTIAPNSPNDVESVMKELFDWVSKTKIFDTPVADTLGDVITPHPEALQILPADTFKRYFLPLLQTICEFIPGCKLSEHENKEDIIRKFVDFGNMDELGDKQNLASLVPEDVRDEIIRQSGVQQLKDMMEDINEIKKEQAKEDEVDPLLEEDPEVFTQTKDEKLPVKRPSIAEIHKKVRTRNPRTEKMQEEFNNNIGKKFFPPGKVDDPKSEKILDSFIGTIEGSENPKTVDLMRNLLFRFIYEKAQQKADDKVVVKTIDYYVNKFKQLANYQDLKALDNFFAKTMISFDRYEPATADDHFTYNMDYIMLVIFPIQKEFALQSKKLEKKQADALPIKKEWASRVSQFRTVPVASKASVDARTGMLMKSFRNDPLVLEKLSGLKLLFDLRGFFQYYEPNNQKSEAVVARYHSIYLNFYQFIAHLRRTLVKDIKNPHQYVLNRLEECMVFTETFEEWSDIVNTHPFCLFSHRKYAEMLFFYKAFLLGGSQKKLDISIDSDSEKEFNTHTREFLVFSNSNSEYNKVLSDNCKTADQKNLNNKSICMSFNFYTDLITYVKNDNIAESSIYEDIQALPNRDSFSTKINVINGLEAGYLFVQNSMPSHYHKFGQLFTFFLDKRSVLNSLLRFTNDDVDQMTLYMQRTYKKLMISKDEENIASIVQTVLETTGDTALRSFLTYNKRVSSFFIKLFLQYAKTHEQFKKIAQLFIDEKFSIELIKMNDKTHDDDHKQFVTAVKRLPSSEAVTAGSDIVRNMLREFYSKFHSISESNADIFLFEEFKKNNQSEDRSLDVLLNQLMGEECADINDEVTANLEKEEETYQEVKEELIQHVVEVTVEVGKNLNEVDIRSLVEEAQSNLGNFGETTQLVRTEVYEAGHEIPITVFEENSVELVVPNKIIDFKADGQSAELLASLTREVVDNKRKVLEELTAKFEAERQKKRIEEKLKEQAFQNAPLKAIEYTPLYTPQLAIEYPLEFRFEKPITVDYNMYLANLLQNAPLKAFQNTPQKPIESPQLNTFKYTPQLAIEYPQLKAIEYNTPQEIVESTPLKTLEFTPDLRLEKKVTSDSDKILADLIQKRMQELKTIKSVPLTNQLLTVLNSSTKGKRLGKGGIVLGNRGKILSKHLVV